jgi:hypothetical protein
MSAADIPQPWQRRPAATAKLPDYAHPPLVQVTLGVGFGPGVTHSERPLREFEQELGPTWRRPDRPQTAPVRGAWETRIQDQRIVVTDRSLTYVWDGLSGDLYPHYPLVREGFVGVWNAWCATGASLATVSEWRVGYDNRIPRGTVWTTLADCSFMKWLSPLTSIESLKEPNFIKHSWQFPLDRFDAALSVALESSDEVESPDEPPNLWLRLTASGRLPDPDDTFLAGFDYGREVIVRTFRQLMQPAANEFWGLKA